MKTNKFLALGAVAAMTALSPGIRAVDVEVKGDVDLPKTETRTEIRTDRDRDLSVSAQADANANREKVRKTEKASGILGMEVRNHQGEKLGEIKDLVMEINSGKVSYAVLALSLIHI